MNIIQIIGVLSNEILSGIEGGVDSLDTDSRHLHLVLSKLPFHVTGKYIYNNLLILVGILLLFFQFCVS